MSGNKRYLEECNHHTNTMVKIKSDQHIFYSYIIIFLFLFFFISGNFWLSFTFGYVNVR